MGPSVFLFAAIARRKKKPCFIRHWPNLYAYVDDVSAHWQRRTLCHILHIPIHAAAWRCALLYVPRGSHSWWIAFHRYCTVWCSLANVFDDGRPNGLPGKMLDHIDHTHMVFHLEKSQENFENVCTTKWIFMWTLTLYKKPHGLRM